MVDIEDRTGAEERTGAENRTGADDRAASDDLPSVAIDELAFNPAGLLPVVVQQHDTGEVLMVAWADAAAIERTRALGEAVFYSRSRREQWHKGATSGNTQRVLEVRVDCDADVILYLVDQGGDGVACHTGERSCFHRRLAAASGDEPADEPADAQADRTANAPGDAPANAPAEPTVDPQAQGTHRHRPSPPPSEHSS